MVDRKEMKMRAKEQIRGNIGILFVCMLVTSVLVAIATPVTLGLGGILVGGPIALSTVMIYLRLTRGRVPVIADVFEGFNFFVQSILLTLLIGLFTFLWTLLFVIPGIVKAYSYSMAYYILADNPNMTALEALAESKRITRGHKMDLFVLHLSFFWWYLLCAVTVGIASVYVAPYVSASQANCYEAIK